MTASPETFVSAALELIVTSPTNPRKTFNEDKLTELARSIKASGVPVSYTHLTLPTKPMMCRYRWSPYH